MAQKGGGGDAGGKNPRDFVGTSVSTPLPPTTPFTNQQVLRENEQTNEEMEQHSDVQQNVSVSRNESVVSSKSSTHPQDKMVPMSRPRDAKGNFIYVTLGKEVKTIRANHFAIKIDKNNSPPIFRYDVEVLPVSNNPKAPAATRVNKLRKREAMDLVMQNAKANFGIDSKAIVYGYDGEATMYTMFQITTPKAVVVKFQEPGGKADEIGVKIKKQIGDSMLLFDLFRDDVAGTDDILAALEVLLLSNSKIKYQTNNRRTVYYPMANPFYLRVPIKEVWAGFYSSARKGEWTMTLNFDVTATVVIRAQSLRELFENARGRNTQEKAESMTRQLNGTKKDVKIEIRIGNEPHQKRPFFKVLPVASSKYTFKDDNGKQWNLIQFYLEKHKVKIACPEFPVVQVRAKREIVFPLEFCSVAPGQLSVSKRESQEQAELVRLMSGMRPQQRYQQTVADFNNRFADPVQRSLLSQLGIELDREPLRIKTARVLPPVKMQDGFGPCHPDQREPGKFGLNRKFYKAINDIGPWAVVDATGKLKREDAQQWIGKFKDALARKSIATSIAPVVRGNVTSFEAIEEMFEKSKNSCKLIVFFVEKNNEVYGYIKQLGDRLHLIATQCIDISKWEKMNVSYMDNVVLKVNVKLDGINFILSRQSFLQNGSLTPPIFDEPVLLVGADVTHPGVDEKTKPSIAAVIGSLDKFATLYNAVISVQSRAAKDDANCTQEWIEGICETMKTLLKNYYKREKQKPKKIIVYRDGVSEGQYSIVLHKELREIQRACRELEATYEPDITYIIVRKRIKTKLYDVTQRGVNQVEPGTIVEADITQPLKFFEWYLVPHYSPLGTAKPTHYVVVYDDSKFHPNEIAYLSFALCHLFPRCARAVSLPVPVYHAHLAAERANYHLMGEPFENPTGERDPARLKRLYLEHVRRVTSMTAEKALPNYWL